MKRYLAISGFNGRDKLYFVSKNVEKKFEKLFGKFDNNWQDHDKAVQWLIDNAKYVNVCTCVSF